MLKGPKRKYIERKGQEKTHPVLLLILKNFMKKIIKELRKQMKMLLCKEVNTYVVQ